MGQEWCTYEREKKKEEEKEEETREKFRFFILFV
jgi:hypothetical protein